MIDTTYLEYPKRRYGQDHEFYKWSPTGGLQGGFPKLELPSDKTVALSFVIPLEFFPLNPSGVPFKHLGAMVTPYPDLRHFTVRDYGNRVGVYRMLTEFAEAGVTVTFAVNAEIARRYPPLIDAITLAGHEIAAHGVSTDHIHHEGLNEAEEAALISTSLAAFVGKPKGWLSPARNQSSNTLALLAKAGVEYCLDWETDRSPMPFNTDHGDIIALPHLNELSDFNLLLNKRQTEADWSTQVIEAVDYLHSEAPRFGPSSLALTLTPYVIGQPFRIAELRTLLSTLTNTPHVWIVSAGELACHYRKSYT